MYWVSTGTGAVEVASWMGDGEDGVTDGEVVPDSIGEGVETTGDDGETTGEDDVTTGEGVEIIGDDDETTGAVVPDSIGEGEDGETWGAVERGGLTGLEFKIIGALLVAGGLGGEQLDDVPGWHSKFIPTMPIGTLGPDGELGWTQTSW